jgi:hypothetical protein
MSSRDERDLAGRLGTALETVTPSALPLDVIRRKGRAIRARRWAAAVAAITAAVAAVSVGAPALLGSGPPGLPAAGRAPVSVHPPGPGSPPGMIAGGTAAGRRWRATVRQASGGLIGYCVTVTAMPPQCASAWYLTRASPVSLTTVHAHGQSAATGPVWHGVARVDIRLTDDAVLHLHPVPGYGLRWVAVVLPARLKIATIAAYSAHGEIAYAVLNHGGKTIWHPTRAAPPPDRISSGDRTWRTEQPPTAKLRRPGQRQDRRP